MISWQFEATGLVGAEKINISSSEETFQCNLCGYEVIYIYCTEYICTISFSEETLQFN